MKSLVRRFKLRCREMCQLKPKGVRITDKHDGSLLLEYNDEEGYVWILNVEELLGQDFQLWMGHY